VSEQQSQPASGETGSNAAASAAPDTLTPGVTAATEAPRLAPEQEETSPKADVPAMDAPTMDAAAAEAPKVEAATPEIVKAEAVAPGVPKLEMPKVDAVKTEAPITPGKVLIMSPGDRAGADATPASDAPAGKRRVAAMAAVVALAAVAGALGGALATAGLGKAGLGKMAVAEVAAPPAKDTALEAAVARIDADIVALKANLEHTAKAGVTQFNKTSDRLEKVEKAQAEPAAKLAKLSEAVDKLRSAQAAAPAAAATPVAAKDITGSIPQQTAAATPAAPPKPEVARMPTVEGWVLRDVANGSALIESRRGMYEVYAGDPVPGLGRVDAIRKQDGRWVVVTSKGLIVPR
jgi:hypothetical protein